jgi:hypothetical protein
MPKALRKYFFGLLVAAYVLTVAGIPVYLHYCGGELAHISYLVKGSNCCGDDDEAEKDGCCHNEHLVLQSLTDFTFKDISNSQLIKASFDLVGSPVFFNTTFSPLSIQKKIAFKVDAPPPQLRQLVVDITVLRI